MNNYIKKLIIFALLFGKAPLFAKGILKGQGFTHLGQKKVVSWADLKTASGQVMPRATDLPKIQNFTRPTRSSELSIPRPIYRRSSSAGASRRSSRGLFSPFQGLSVASQDLIGQMDQEPSLPIVVVGRPRSAAR